MMMPIHKTVQKQKDVAFTEEEKYAKQRLRDLYPQDRAAYYLKQHISDHKFPKELISDDDYAEFYLAQHPVGAGYTFF